MISSLRDPAHFLHIFRSKLDLKRTKILLQVLANIVTGQYLYKWRVRDVRTLTFRVPGMGMISGPCASSHARAICPGVALYLSAMELSASTSFKTLGKFSCENLIQRSAVSQAFVRADESRHIPRYRAPEVVLFEVVAGFLQWSKILMQSFAKQSPLTYWPVSSPRPNGEYATIAMPSSRAVRSTSV